MLPMPPLSSSTSTTRNHFSDLIDVYNTSASTAHQTQSYSSSATNAISCPNPMYKPRFFTIGSSSSWMITLSPSISRRPHSLAKVYMICSLWSRRSSTHSSRLPNSLSYKTHKTNRSLSYNKLNAHSDNARRVSATEVHRRSDIKQNILNQNELFAR